MELGIGTPALLFSTVSLLMIAFTNRFMSMASLIRGLHDKFRLNPDDSILKQIQNLRLRMKLIQYMQIVAIFSLILSVICMFLLFMDEQLIARCERFNFKGCITKLNDWGTWNSKPVSYPDAWTLENGTYMDHDVWNPEHADFAEFVKIYNEVKEQKHKFINFAPYFVTI